MISGNLMMYFSRKKQIFIVRRIITILLLFVAIGSTAQESNHFSLFTDRDLYTSGETILFKLFAPEEAQSGIVSVDLITIGGKILAGINKKLNNHQADGFIYLPDSLKTGTYLLCASTCTTPMITVKELLICNRFTGLTETTTILKAKENLAITEKSSGIEIEGIEKTYKSRDKAHATIHISSEILSQLKDDLLVSVVERTPGYKSVTSITHAYPTENGIKGSYGLLLEGMAKDIDTGEPFKNGCIFLSIPDSIPGLRYFITGEDGRFNFELNNYYGKLPVVVQGYDLAKKRLLKISVNQRDSLAITLPAFEAWPVPADLQQLINSNIEATTLRKIFNSRELSFSETPSEKMKDYPFYGIPTEVVNPSLFVELPDFTEISRELLAGVKFRAYNRVPTIQILNPATLNFYNDQPLVLLDGIPIQDLNVIKSMGTEDIRRIEVCRQERFYGDLVFPGVVAIYSKTRDFKRLAESADLAKLNFEALQQDAVFNTPKNQPPNEPDLRKVLLWKPTLKPGETVQTEFDISDIRGSFQMIVRGITSSGSIIYKEQSFEVK